MRTTNICKTKTNETIAGSFYAIQPGNGLGLFYSPYSPDRARTGSGLILPSAMTATDTPTHRHRSYNLASLGCRDI